MAKKKSKFKPPQLTVGAPSVFDPLLLEAAVAKAEAAIEEVVRDAPKIIRRWRLGRKPRLSYRELGHHTGLSGEYISQIERGVRPATLNAVKKILSVMVLHGRITHD